MGSLQALFSENSYVQWAAVFAFVLLLLLLFGYVLRKISGQRLRSGGTSRQRQPRLGYTEVFDLDRDRKLVLLRRDNIEHLVMIGGPNDVLIEANVIRGQAARPQIPSESLPDRIEPDLPLPSWEKPAPAPNEAQENLPLVPPVRPAAPVLQQPAASPLPPAAPPLVAPSTSKPQAAAYTPPQQKPATPEMPPLVKPVAPPPPVTPTPVAPIPSVPQPPPLVQSAPPAPPSPTPEKPAAPLSNRLEELMRRPFAKPTETVVAGASTKPAEPTPADATKPTEPPKMPEPVKAPEHAKTAEAPKPPVPPKPPEPAPAASKPDPLDLSSLEEEMAKLLGRPAGKP